MKGRVELKSQKHTFQLKVLCPSAPNMYMWVKDTNEDPSFSVDCVRESLLWASASSCGVLALCSVTPSTIEIILALYVCVLVCVVRIRVA